MATDQVPGPPFPREEFEVRLQRTREGLEERNLDAGVFFGAESIYYLSGYGTPSHYGFQLLVVPTDQDPFFVTRQHMASGFQVSSWLDQCISFPDDADPIRVTCQALADRHLADARLALEEAAPPLTVRTARALAEGLGDARFGDCSGIVDTLRLVKSPLEVDTIRRGAQVTDVGMEAARAAVAADASEHEIAAEILRQTTLAGGDQQAGPVLVGIGERTRLAMPVPTSRRLNPGEVLWAEVFGTVKRYAAGLKSTLGAGPASKDSERRLETARVALQRGIDAIAPGRPASVIAEAVQETFREAGFADSSHHQSGYSMGIAIPPNPHEARMLSLHRTNTTVLEEGMTLHPIANLYGSGPYIGVSQFVVVTADGVEVLTRYQHSVEDLMR